MAMGDKGFRYAATCETCALSKLTQGYITCTIAVLPHYMAEATAEEKEEYQVNWLRVPVGSPTVCDDYSFEAWTVTSTPKTY